MANCVDWEELAPAEYRRRWHELASWVQRVMIQTLQYPVPWCWPHHPVVVDELRALHCWHRDIMHAGAGAAEDLLRFHDSVRRALAEWPKPCLKGTDWTRQEARDRVIQIEAKETAALLDKVVREQYLARTGARP